MACFTTEERVRAKFQLADTALVPSALIESAIEDAHTELLRHLDPEADTDPPDPALVMGETLLSGAHLYRTLAGADAFAQKRVSIGSHRIEEGERFRALTAVAAFTEKQAWYILEPFLTGPPPRTVCDSTPSRPVMGE